MANYAVVQVETKENLDFIAQLKIIMDGSNYEEVNEAKGKIIFDTRESDLSALMDEILKVTKNYPTEEFTLTMSHEYDQYSIDEIYKAKNGECSLYKKECSYMPSQQSLHIPEEAKPLLEEAIECFRKLDVDKEGEPEHSPHKHTIELEGENYKIIVSKEANVYGVDKVFKKVPSYEWEERNEQLPF